MATNNYRKKEKLSKRAAQALKEEIAAKDREIEAMRRFQDSILKSMAVMKDFQNNILNSMHEGVFTTDEEGNITSFNKAAERITGFKSSQVIGMKCRDVLRTPVCKKDCPLKKVLKTGQTMCYYETNIVNRNNQAIPVSTCLSALKDVKGKTIGIVEVFQDITELKGLQERLIQSEKLALMGRLAAGVAHEINNPISGILTYIKLLSQKTQKGRFEQSELEKIKRYLTIIERETNRCGTIVRHLLDFARPAKPDIKPIDIKSVLEQGISLLQDQLKHQNIKINKEIASPLPKVMADFSQLQQVFMNIMLNASEAMPDGGELKISINAKEKDFVTVELSDTGYGIPEENITKIFDPFFTTKAEKEGKGLGLGLSIVQGIIKDHHGHIDVKSKIEEGTTFTIKLPTTRDKVNLQNKK